MRLIRSACLPLAGKRYSSFAVSVVRGISRMHARYARHLHRIAYGALLGTLLTFEPGLGVHGNKLENQKAKKLSY